MGAVAVLEAGDFSPPPGLRSFRDSRNTPDPCRDLAVTWGLPNGGLGATLGSLPNASRSCARSVFGGRVKSGESLSVAMDNVLQTGISRVVTVCLVATDKWNTAGSHVPTVRDLLG